MLIPKATTPALRATPPVSGGEFLSRKTFFHILLGGAGVVCSKSRSFLTDSREALLIQSVCAAIYKERAKQAPIPLLSREGNARRTAPPY